MDKAGPLLSWYVLSSSSRSLSASNKREKRSEGERQSVSEQVVGEMLFSLNIFYIFSQEKVEKVES